MAKTLSERKRELENDKTAQTEGKSRLDERREYKSIGLDTFETDLGKLSDELVGLDGWRDQDTMTGYGKSVADMLKRANAYKSYYSGRDAGFDSTGIDGVIKWLNDANEIVSRNGKIYGAFDSAENYNKWYEDYQAEQKIVNSPQGKQGWQKYLDDVEKSKQAAIQKENEKTGWEKFLEIATAGFNAPSDTYIGSGMMQASIDAYREDDRYRRPNDNWTEAQKNTFGYYYLESPVKAYAYAEKINNGINLEAEQAALKKITDSATSNFWAGLGHTAGAIAAAPLGLADFLDDIARNNAGRDIPVADGWVSPFEYSKAVTGGITEHLNEISGTLDERIPLIGGKGLGDAYGWASSTAQSIASAYALGPAGMLVSYFGQGAASSVDEKIAQGWSDDAAILYGTAVGLIDGALEAIGGERMLNLGSASTVKSFIRQVAEQAVAEGFEGGLSSLSSKVAEDMINRIYQSGATNFDLLVEKYMAEGMSEPKARRKAWWDLIEEVAFDAVSEGLSGAVGGEIQIGGQTISANKQASETYGESVSDLVKESLEIDPNNQFAQRMQTKLDGGKNLTGGQINRLIEANEIAMRGQDISAIENAAMERLTTLGETGNVEAIAKALTKQVQGENLTRHEKQTIENSKYGQRVANELNTENIKSGQYSSAWAERIGTNRINAKEYGRGLAGEEARGGAEGVSTSEREGNATNAPQGANLAAVAGETAGASPRPTEGADAEDTRNYDRDILAVSKAAEVLGKNSMMATAYLEENKGKGDRERQSANAYIDAYRTVYSYAKSGVSEESVKSIVYGKGSNSGAALTEAQFREAYKEGRRVYETSHGIKNAASGEATSGEKIVANTSEAGKAAKKAGSVKYSGGRVMVKGVEYVLPPVKNLGKLNAEQRAAVDFAEKVLANFGVDVVFFSSKTNRNLPNGIYDGKRIYIDIEAGVSERSSETLVAYAMAHELTHMAERLSPELWQRFADRVLQILADEKGVSVEGLIKMQQQADADARFGQLRAMYPSLSDEAIRAKIETIDPAGAIREIVADAAQTIFTTKSNLMEKLAEMESDPWGADSKKKDLSEGGKSLVEVIWDLVKACFRKLQSILRSMPDDGVSRHLQSHLDELAAYYDEMMADTLMKARDGVVAENGGDAQMQAKRDYPIDTAVQSVVDNAFSKSGSQMHELGIISADQNKIINRLSNQQGNDFYRGKFTGGKHLFSDNAIRHIISEHGDFLREGLRAQLPMTREDIARHLSAVKEGKTPTNTEGTRTARGNPSILTAYQVNGYTLYAEEITRSLDANKPSDLIGHTMYKAPTLATAAVLATSARTLPRRQSTVLCNYYIPSTGKMSRGNFVTNKNGETALLSYQTVNGGVRGDKLLGGLIALSSDANNFIDRQGTVEQGYVVCQKPFYITSDHRVFSNSDTDVAEKINELKKKGYDCFIFEQSEGDNYMVAVVNKAQIIKKKPTVITDGNTSANNSNNGQTQTRRGGGSDRAVLAEALESAVLNERDGEILGEYKRQLEHYRGLQEEADRLEAEKDAEWQRMRSGEAQSSSRYEKLAAQYQEIRAELAEADKALLDMEAMTPIKNAAAQMRNDALKAQKATFEQRQKEALVKQREDIQAKQDERRRKAEETRERSQLLARAERVINRLYRKITKPTKNDNIPSELMPLVKQLFEYVDVSHHFATIAKLEAERDAINDRIADLKARGADASVIDAQKARVKELNERIMKLENVKHNVTWAERGGLLQEIMAKVEANNDVSGIYTTFAPGLAERMQRQLDTFTDRGTRTRLFDMDVDTLRFMVEAIESIGYSITEAHKLHAGARAESIATLGENTIAEFQREKKEAAKAKLLAGGREFFAIDSLTPHYFAHRLGGGTETVFSALSEGFNDTINKIRVIEAFRDKIYDKYKIETWTGKNERLHSVGLEQGGNITLTTTQIMTLYALSDRPQAQRHIYGQGVQSFRGDLNEVIEKATPLGERMVDEAKRLVGKSENALSANAKLLLGGLDIHKMTKKDVESLIDQLTSDQRACVKDIKKFLHDTVTPWGNAVTQELYLYNMFEDPHYFPIETVKTLLPVNEKEEKAKDAGQMSIFSILNKGFTKQVDEKAANPIVIRNIFEVFMNHAFDMANYGGMGVAVSDTIKWLNYKRPVLQNENSQTSDEVQVDNGAKAGYNENKELTESEAGAVNFYKGGQSYMLNALLRENPNVDELPERFREVAEDLDRALQKLPTYEGVTYRNIGFDDNGGKEEFDAFIKKHPEGQLIYYPAYTSTSTSVDGYPVDGDFVVHMVIQGTNGRNLDGYGNNMESEVLFERESVFFVEKVEYDEKGVPTMYMQEVDENGTGQLRSDQRGATMRDVQALDSHESGVQGISERETEGNYQRTLGSQGELSRGQRDPVRAQGPELRSGSTLRQEQSGVSTEAVSVRSAMEEAYGEAAYRYIKNFLMSIEGTLKGTDGAKLLNKLTRNVKIASVGANLRVVALQGTAYIRAGAVLSGRNLVRALMPHKSYGNEAIEKNALMYYKSLGFYDMNNSRSLLEKLKGGGTKADKLREWSTFLAGKADEATWGNIWLACRYEVDDYIREKKLGDKIKRGSAEYFKLVNEKFDEVIDFTQVIDSPFHKNKLMSDPDSGMKQVTAFMAEPMLTYNMIQSAASDWIRHKPGGRQKFRRVAVVWLVQFAAVVAVESIVDAARDRDDDEDLLEKYLQAVARNAFGINLGGKTTVGSVLGAEWNILNNLPIVKEIFSVLEGYDPSRMDITGIANLASSIEKAMRYVTGQSKASADSVIYSLTQAVSQVCGIPFSNLYRTIRSLINSIRATFGLNTK